jgi:hypothetical protein
LLEAALDMTLDRYHSVHKSEILGDLSPTKAIKILLQRSVSTMEAADVIKRIFELSGRDPAEGSLSARALRYARQRRRAGSGKKEEGF